LLWNRAVLDNNNAQGSCYLLGQGIADERQDLIVTPVIDHQQDNIREGRGLAQETRCGVVK
jgi:hypothetical protein